ANVPGLGCGAQWFGVKWSRAVGMLLCHCGVALRLALKLYGRQETSVHEFRNPESAADLGSAEPGVLWWPRPENSRVSRSEEFRLPCPPATKASSICCASAMTGS